LPGERGQALLLMVAGCAVMLSGSLVLFAFGQALGAKGRHQRAADLAAVSAARAMVSAGRSVRMLGTALVIATPRLIPSRTEPLAIAIPADPRCSLSREQHSWRCALCGVCDSGWLTWMGL
jgi:hypothetical protein